MLLCEIDNLGRALLRLSSAHVPREIPTAFWPENVGSFRSSRPQTEDFSHFTGETHCCVENRDKNHGEDMLTKTWTQETHFHSVKSVEEKKNGTATGIAVLVSFSRTTAFQSPLLPGPQTSTRDILVRFCVPSGAKTSQYFAHETILHIGTQNLQFEHYATTNKICTPCDTSTNIIGMFRCFSDICQKDNNQLERTRRNCTRCEVPKQTQRFVDRFYKSRTYSRILRQ